MLRKARSYSEVYNDLDGEVVNLFRVLRGGRADELTEAIRLTPYAREEFLSSGPAAGDPVESARRLMVLSFLGFGSDGHNAAVPTGFRSNAHRNGTVPATDWAHLPESLRRITDRLRGVLIENRPALKVMDKNDRPDTLHYLDPPYPHATRTRKVRNSYKHEMYDSDHAVLLEKIKGLEGMVVLSSYPNGMYDRALRGWRKVERQSRADGARKRTEVLWINPAAARGIQGSLF